MILAQKTETNTLGLHAIACDTVATGDLMDPEHTAHLARILKQFSADASAKYSAGQAEHGGNLWEKPGMLDHAIEEAIDLVVYLYTLREQRDRGMRL